MANTDYLLASLTPREKEVIDLIRQHHNIAAIARLLGVKPTSVKRYVAAVARRHGITTKHLRRTLDPWLGSRLGERTDPRR